jgi:hypothetical protein
MSGSQRQAPTAGGLVKAMFLYNPNREGVLSADCPAAESIGPSGVLDN